MEISGGQFHSDWLKNSKVMSPWNDVVYHYIYHNYLVNTTGHIEQLPPQSGSRIYTYTLSCSYCTCPRDNGPKFFPWHSLIYAPHKQTVTMWEIARTFPLFPHCVTILQNYTIIFWYTTENGYTVNGKSISSYYANAANMWYKRIIITFVKQYLRQLCDVFISENAYNAYQ